MEKSLMEAALTVEGSKVIDPLYFTTGWVLRTLGLWSVIIFNQSSASITYRIYIGGKKRPEDNSMVRARGTNREVSGGKIFSRFSYFVVVDDFKIDRHTGIRYHRYPGVSRSRNQNLAAALTSFRHRLFELALQYTAGHPGTMVANGFHDSHWQNGKKLKCKNL